jgi:hypothetical protein
MFTWFDWPDGGVLEFHEALTAPGPALELRLFTFTNCTFGLWVSEDGAVLRAVRAWQC